MARTIRLGTELEKASEEQKNYQEFQRLLKEVVEVNEKICQLRPIRDVADEEELEALKKNSRGGLPGSGAGNNANGWTGIREPARTTNGYGSNRECAAADGASTGKESAGEIVEPKRGPNQQTG
jgi:hypothetical protein